MSIAVTCECGHRLDLRDEFGGKQVRCPSCDRTLQVGAAGAAVPKFGDPALDRDTFLLKQQVMTVQERYDVVDENGQPILFSERPRHWVRAFASLALFVLVLAVLVGLFGFITPQSLADTPAGRVAVIVEMLVAFAAAAAVGIASSAKRHISFYRDEAGRQKLFDILQDSKFQPITMTFTARDGSGKVIGRFQKNIFTNILRRRWIALTPSGATIFVAKEDSVLLSLLRRLLGPFFGLLRAHFIFTRGTSDTILGEFNRKLSLLDRYVLDLSKDPKRQIDRRLALAMGILLDSGERR